LLAHPSESGVFFIARQRLYKTTSNGSSWTAVSSNINGSSAVRELYISHSNPQILFAASGSSVFKSIDGGVNWTNTTSGLPARTITSVRIHPTDPKIVLLTFSGFSTNKVYKSTNGGASWFSIHGNLPDSPVNDLVVYTEDIQGPNTYFIANDVGVFVTRNDGVNWVELDSGLPNTVVMHLDYHPLNKMLRAGTHGRGVYEYYIDYYIPVELVSFSTSVR
jgi:xyloglucan-specific exo-beta-1,4-glucanase